MASLDSFKTKTTLTSGSQTLSIYCLKKLEESGFPNVARLPFSLKILLENLLRREDDAFVKADDISTLAGWSAAPPGYAPSALARSCGSSEISTPMRSISGAPGDWGASVSPASVRAATLDSVSVRTSDHA